MHLRHGTSLPPPSKFLERPNPNTCFPSLQVKSQHKAVFWLQENGTDYSLVAYQKEMSFAIVTSDGCIVLDKLTLRQVKMGDAAYRGVLLAAVKAKFGDCSDRSIRMYIQEGETVEIRRRA